MNLSMLSNALPTPDNDVVWYDVISKFKNYATKFASQYNELKNTGIDPDKYPELADEQLDLLRRGNSIQNSIREITGQVDSTWTWLKSQFGFSGLADVSNLTPGLGFVPLIPLAVVAGSVALIAKWIFDYNEFSTKLSEVKRLEQKGYSSVQASEIVDKLFGDKGIFSDIGKALPYIAVGGIGLLLYMNRNR